MKIDKSRSIGVASAELGLESHVLRFWEKEFPQIKPAVGKGSRRYYYDKDIENVLKIKYFLHELGYTIAGLKTFLTENKELFKKNLDEIKKAMKISDRNFSTEENLDSDVLLKLHEKLKNIFNRLETVEKS